MEKPVTRSRPTVRPQVTLLGSGALDSVCTRGHVRPSPNLATFLAIGWSMKWNVPPNESFPQQFLPNPCVQLVVGTAGPAQVFGVVTGAFSITLEGAGYMFGVRFRPCGFRAILRQPACRFTNRRVPLAELLPDVDGEGLQRLAEAADDAGLMALIEDALCPLAPASDEFAVKLEALIARMESDSEMVTVEQAAAYYGTGSRTLQRLFHEYVGVSPKWILRRFRLKEAAARIERGEHDNMADLAQRLGYYDQAHLNRDFRTFVGQPPAAWAALRNRSR